MYREVALAWAEFYCNWNAAKGLSRALHDRSVLDCQRRQRLMKRVAMRLQMREAFDGVKEWRAQMLEDLNQSRAMRLMKQASARMVNKELVMSFVQFCQNHRTSAIEQYRQEIQMLKLKVHSAAVAKSRAIMKALFAQFRSLRTHEHVLWWKFRMILAEVKAEHDSNVMEIVNAFAS